MKTALVAAMIAILLVGRALGVLGVGDIVYDPSNFEQALRQFAQLEQQYEQLVRTYQTLQSQYNHMVRMSQRVPVEMNRRYRALTSPWRSVSASDTYGGSGSWVKGVNTGNDVPAAYEKAIEHLGTYGSAFGNLSAGEQDRVRKDYATVELTDGINLAGLQAIGDLRGRSAQVETVIADLENDALSSDPAMNTDVALLNKLNATEVISLRSARDANKLLATIAEQQILAAKRQRDADAQAFNNHIRFTTEGRAILKAQAANASSAMKAWRMP